MPLRDFKCNECGKLFDFLILNKDDEKELSCPACSSRNLVKLLSLFGFSGALERPVTSGGGGGGCPSCGGGSCSSCGH